MTQTSELIARIQYIIDPTASAKDRLHRRSHLTNHDFHLILSALEGQPDPEARALLEEAAAALEREGLSDLCTKIDAYLTRTAPQCADPEALADLIAGDADLIVPARQGPGQ